MDTHEGKGGLRAMFSRTPHREEQESEAEEGKKKKGFFGLGGKTKDHDEKDKDKGKFSRKLRKSDAESDGYRHYADDGDPPSNGQMQDSAEWTHVGMDKGRISPMPGYVAASMPTTRVASPVPPPQLASSAVFGPQLVAHKVGRKEREKAIRESQERTKEFLKAENKDRERAEKEAAKADREEQRKRGEYGSVTWAISR